MALSVILRQSLRAQGIELLNLLRSPLHKSVTTQNYTQTFSHANKNATILHKTFKAKMFEPLKRNVSADFAKNWRVERIGSAILVIVLPAAFIAPHFIWDNALALVTVFHFHSGMEAVVTDYVRPPKLPLLALHIISLLTVGGLVYFNYNDVGIGKAGRRLWGIKS